MKNPIRVIAEIELLSSHFGPVEFDPQEPSTVLIEQFDLPPGYNRKHTRVLLDLGYQYPEYPVRDFYIDPGLRRKKRRPGHYHEDGFDSKTYCNEGFAWYCLHIQDWQPNPFSIADGDNLLTACQALYEALKSG